MSSGINASTARRATTLRDVAELAGVSVATVSKVMNNRAGISDGTRATVEAAAETLQFRPNPMAQSLLAGRTNTVGLLTNDLIGRFSLPILMGAEDALGAGSLSVFLCDARGDAIREQHHLNALLNRRVDGLIVVADSAAPRPSLGRDLPVPVVYAYGASFDDDDMSVVTDSRQAGRVGVEHLLSVGRTRIAYVGGDRHFAAARQRAEGAGSALAAAGLEFAIPPLFGPWSERWGRQATRMLIERGTDIDAVMCGSDQIARGVMDALAAAGRAVPGDIAVLGHDNWEIFAAEATPPLTTIDMNFQEVGRFAAQLLSEAMAGNPRPGQHVVDSRVVVRESTF
ncbi:LacI family DNA-binding transcriptional regulator [Galbitalea sp. SE-J8]|uniref:LacI family DNA-binding transcriptional regulator n=1 Tax=Galbitalea sp. SE-J8 TaxID=3054952 RepID=UPI00259C7D34|nr:LacI family DNA-binding transcriptional regulator [Galbitalea sp. SE-J8]MDM4762000.1 LacI family DNA-binding transcriptional regulator [Galbitalea sp. SE-J8]